MYMKPAKTTDNTHLRAVGPFYLMAEPSYPPPPEEPCMARGEFGMHVDPFAYKQEPYIPKNIVHSRAVGSAQGSGRFKRPEGGSPSTEGGDSK